MRGPKQGGREGATGFSDFAAPDKKPKLNWKVGLSPAPQTAFGFHSPVLSGDGSIYYGSPTGHVWGYTPNGVLIVVSDVKAKIEGKLSACFLPSFSHFDGSVLARLARRDFWALNVRSSDACCWQAWQRSGAT
jgi:hypothetical protein